MAGQVMMQPGRTAVSMQSTALFICRHWMLAISLVFGLYVGLPFLAPLLMAVGLETPARLIYFVYSFLCHQLPQRSFFLFGEQFTYSLTDIQAAWHNTNDMAVLRRFIGTPEMGWKVAWSDRMVFMYASILLAGWIWYPLRRRIPPLPWWGFALLLVPMLVDGLSHMVSDLYGLGLGYRASNAWLADLTQGTLSPAFYAGDAWGSFNSLMRMLTGILFGIGIVGFGFPYLEWFFLEMRTAFELKINRLQAAHRSN